MRLDLAVGCPGVPAPSIYEHCGVIYPDLIGTSRTRPLARGDGRRLANRAPDRALSAPSWRIRIIGLGDANGRTETTRLPEIG
jgi:hypothetical protein